MADASAFWSGAVTTAFGVVLGFSLTGVREILKSQRERRGHWLALRADIIRAGTLAAGYIDGKVLVPTTRLPMRAYHDSFPALLMAELLAEEEIEKLSRFFDNADSFNRSLNY